MKLIFLKYVIFPNSTKITTMFFTTIVICSISLLYYYIHLCNVEIIFWNLLCEALGNNQFLSNGGDKENVDWEKRKYKICDTIANQISYGRIFTAVEVDNFPFMMDYFDKYYSSLDIHGIFIPKINTNKNNSNNNFSIYVTTLLNKYDKSIKIVPNLKGEKLTEAYTTLVKYYTNEDYTEISKTIKTFEDNGVDKVYMSYVKFILNYDIEENMPYVSFDCSAMFWSGYNYNLDTIMSPANNYNANEEELITDMEFNVQHLEEDGFMGARFTRNSIFNKKRFDIFVAHIKSGENERSEFERVNSIKSIIKIIDTVGNKNRIICMDSNTGKNYERSFKKGSVFNKKNEYMGMLNNFVSELYIKNNYFNNIIQSKDTMCFKMRAGSDQIDKNGEFMADTIDAILTPYYLTTNTFSPYQSIITDEEYKLIMSWRLDKKCRDAIKAECNNPKNMWQNDTNKNIVSDELVNILMDTKDSHSNEHYRSIVEEIFNKFYPNYDNASDHPMVGLSVNLS